MRRMVRDTYLVKREVEKGIVMRKAVGWMSFPVIVLLFLMQTTMGLAADLALDNPRTMRFPTVEFNPPDAERLVLENGMVVYLLEDHELPLVTVNATLRTGSWLDPADKVGLAGMTGAVMRTGGSARMFPEEIDEELEQLAATVSIGFAMSAAAGRDNVTEANELTPLLSYVQCQDAQVLPAMRDWLTHVYAVADVAQGYARRAQLPAGGWVVTPQGHPVGGQSVVLHAA